MCVSRRRTSRWVTDNVKVCHCASCHLGRPTACQSGNSLHKSGIQLKMSLNNKQLWAKYSVRALILFSLMWIKNYQRLQLVQLAIDILCLPWFHLMGWVGHLHWLEVSKPDWSCDSSLLWFHMQIKQDRHVKVDCSGSRFFFIFFPLAFKVNSILSDSLKGDFHQCRGIQAWTRNLWYRKFGTIFPAIHMVTT